MAISQGLGGPKGKPKGLTNGQSINISTPPLENSRKTKSSTLGGLLDFHLQHKIFQVLQKFSSSEGEIQKSTLPRKFLLRFSNGVRTANRHR